MSININMLQNLLLFSQSFYESLLLIIIGSFIAYLFANNYQKKKNEKQKPQIQTSKIIVFGDANLEKH